MFWSNQSRQQPNRAGFLVFKLPVIIAFVLGLAAGIFVGFVLAALSQDESTSLGRLDQVQDQAGQVASQVSQVQDQAGQVATQVSQVIEPVVEFASPGDNDRQHDIDHIALAIGQYLETGNPPANWSDLAPIAGPDLIHYSPANINAAGAWASGSAAGVFIDFAAIANPTATEQAGGLKLTGSDDDAPDQALIFRRATCNQDFTGLLAGTDNQLAVVYRFETETITTCFKV